MSLRILRNNGLGNLPGTNLGFMRIGMQPATPIDADRRLEVFDATALAAVNNTKTSGI